MSLILDALRKSEAERRRGQAPDLFTPTAQPAPLPAAAPVTGARRGAVIAGGLLLAVAAWWLLARSGDPAAGNQARAVASAPASAVTVDSAPVVEPPVAANDLPPRATPAATIASTRSTDVPSPAPAPLGTDAAATGMPGAPSAVDAPVRPPASATPVVAVTQPTPVTRAPLPAPPSAAPAKAAPDRPVAAGPGVSPALATTQPAVVAPPPRPAPTTTLASPAPARAAADDGTVRLADLASGERTQLPPLKMSMHMWAPDPARRFVILDGSRVGEGDRVGDAVVDEITADSAVLAWHGRRIKVPLR